MPHVQAKEHQSQSSLRRYRLRMALSLVDWAAVILAVVLIGAHFLSSPHTSISWGSAAAGIAAFGCVLILSRTFLYLLWRGRNTWKSGGTSIQGYWGVERIRLSSLPRLSKMKFLLKNALSVEGYAESSTVKFARLWLIVGWSYHWIYLSAFWSRESLHEPWDFKLVSGGSQFFMEQAFLWIFEIDLILRFAGTERKAKTIFSVLGIIEAVTLSPANFIAMHTGGDESYAKVTYMMHLGFVRFFLLLGKDQEFIDLFKVTSRKSSLICQLVSLALDITVIVFTFAGCMFMLDGYDAPNRDSFWVFVYFAAVTLTTVGYGDMQPSSSTAQAVVTLAILASFVYLPYKASNLIEKAKYRKDAIGYPIHVFVRQQLRGLALGKMRDEFILLVGTISPQRLHQLLAEIATGNLWQHDRLTFSDSHYQQKLFLIKRVVFLTPYEPMEFESIVSYAHKALGIQLYVRREELFGYNYQTQIAASGGNSIFCRQCAREASVIFVCNLDNPPLLPVSIDEIERKLALTALLMAGGDMGKRLHVVLQKADSVLVELLTNVGVSQVVALQNLMTELMVASLLKNRLLCTLYGCLTSCATLAYLPVPTSFYGRNTESTCPLLRLSFVQASTKRTFQISVLPEGLFHIKLITFASWLFEKCRITLLGIQWDSGAGATSITLPHPEYLLGTPAYVGECLYEPRGLIVLGTEENLNYCLYRMKEDASYLASLQPPESGMASVQGSRLDLKRGWSQLPMMTSTLQLRIVTGYRPTAASFDNSILVLGWPSNFTSFVQRAVSNAKGEGTLYILAPMKPADLEKIEAERPSTANLFLNIVPGNPRSVADLQRAGVMFVKRCIVLNHGLERVGHPSKDYLATEVYSLVMKLRRDDPNFFCSVSLVNVRLGCVSYQNHCLPIVSAVTQFDTPTVMPSGSIQAVMSGRGLTDSLMFGAVTRHLALGDVDCLSLSRFLQSDRVAVIPLWKYIVHQSFSELFQFFIDECIGIPFALDCCVDNERLLVVGPPDDFEITGDMQTVVAKFVSEEMVDV